MTEKSAPKTSNQTSTRSRAKAESAHPAKKKEFRLQSIEIHNFKAIKELFVDFQQPRMPDDPDVFAMGSKNGLGKTSVLEACLLLFLAATIKEDALQTNFRRYEGTFDLFDLMIRAGAKSAEIVGTFLLQEKPATITLTFNKEKHVSIKGDTEVFQTFIRKMDGSQVYKENPFSKFMLSLAGLSNEPMLLSPLLYFHSYRKVQEGSLELSRMLEDDQLVNRRPFLDRREQPVSSFKIEILRLLMSRGGLFEDLEDDKKTQEVRNKLNSLTKQYAGGTIEKIRQTADNTIEFRITPSNGGPSFTFDGLSSGQKEIISTLFLIWRYTQKQSGIVLIDEPELHLNPEWHKGFVRCLYELAPDNQYVLATHSEDVFAAVARDHRILLLPDEEEM